LYSYEIDVEKVKNIIKNTGLSSFSILDSIDQLKTGISEMTPSSPPSSSSPDAINIESKAKENGGSGGGGGSSGGDGKQEKEKDDGVCVSIDHAFDVKGVGTVVLGSVKQGEIKTYDELTLNPANKPVLIKSIQMHDDPVNTSKRPSRVGLAIKGVSAKDISRGDIITSPGLAIIANNEFQIKFIKNQFFKEEISETQNYMVCVGLQIRTVKLKQNGGGDSNLKVQFEKPMAYVKGEKCVLFRPDSKGMRIMGYGIMQ
jgi:selenocysteine-specific translation elongation factor